MGWARPAGLGPPPVCSIASQSRVEVRSPWPSATGGSSSSPGKPALLRFVGNDLGCSRNRGTVLAPHKALDTRILSCSLHFIGIPRSEEFDLSAIHNQPHLYLLQFAGCLVGPEPLRVSFEAAF